MVRHYENLSDSKSTSVPATHYLPAYLCACACVRVCVHFATAFNNSTSGKDIGKVLIGEMSGRGNVRSGKCPVGEVSGRGSVRSGKCPVGEVSVGEVSENLHACMHACMHAIHTTGEKLNNKSQNLEQAYFRKTMIWN